MVSDTSQDSPNNPHRSPTDRMIWILRIGVCACFGGWAWQHLRWSAPYDAMLWHPDYFGWLADRIGVTWDEYIAQVMTDRRIRLGVRMTGVVYLVLACFAFTAKRRSVFQQTCLAIGSLLLAILAYCKYVDAGYAMPTLVEHGGQVLIPVVLILALRLGQRHRATLAVAMFAFWTTFAGHGIYAAGIAPTPGRFYGLVHATLGLGPESSDLLLKTAGILDFVVCFGAIVPPLRRFCFAYATVWGLLTALARPVAGMSLEADWWGADQFLHEAILRAPHACLPLFLYFAFRSKQASS